MRLPWVETTQDQNTYTQTARKPNAAHGLIGPNNVQVFTADKGICRVCIPQIDEITADVACTPTWFACAKFTPGSHSRCLLTASSVHPRSDTYLWALRNVASDDDSPHARCCCARGFSSRTRLGISSGLRGFLFDRGFVYLRIAQVSDRRSVHIWGLLVLARWLGYGYACGALLLVIIVRSVLLLGVWRYYTMSRGQKDRMDEPLLVIVGNRSKR
jgi:hypothetical protein